MLRSTVNTVFTQEDLECNHRQPTVVIGTKKRIHHTYYSNLCYTTSIFKPALYILDRHQRQTMALHGRKTSIYSTDGKYGSQLNDAMWLYYKNRNTNFLGTPVWVYKQGAQLTFSV